MESIESHYIQLPLTLRFSVTLDLYLESLLLGQDPSQHTMGIGLPLGFHITVTDITHALSDSSDSASAAGPDALEFYPYIDYGSYSNVLGTVDSDVLSIADAYDIGIHGLFPSAVELSLSHHKGIGDAEDGQWSDIKEINTLHFIEIYGDEYALHLSKAVNCEDLLEHGVSFKFLQGAGTADVEYAVAQRIRGSSADPTTSSESFAFVQPPEYSLAEAIPFAAFSLRDINRVPAHRAVMRQWPVFAKLLRNFTRPGDDPIVHKLIGIDAETMQLVVNFIYLRQIEGPRYTGTVDWRRVFQLAHRFKINPLAEIALEKMCQEIRNQDVLPTLFLWAYQHSDYEKRLLNIVVENMEKVWGSGMQAALQPYKGHPQFLRIYQRLGSMVHARKS
ncbi:hypothetical protein BGZ58_000378 [Dissophora ornata]|nr:hypothetical protein BGZ58_000378 [Dissophora ornata]